jgi:DNA-binding MarR family transcriptional regulator
MLKDNAGEIVKGKKQIRDIQGPGIDFKVVAAFERISQVIRTLSWKTGKMLRLNPVQSQVLVFLLYHDKEGNNISSLAREFNISKASISDTVSSLERKQLVRKACADGDARNINIGLTKAGQQAAAQAALYAHDLTMAINKLSPVDKQQLFSILGEVIFELHTSGVVPVQRMCKTCKHYDSSGKTHYCRLLERSLHADQLQIDCADHRSK